MIEAFTAGGIIIDNVITADGAVHLETMGGNAVYSAAGAKLWLGCVGIVGVVPRNYPSLWLDRLAASGMDIAGITTVDETVDCSEWFFYRADGSRADYLHAETGVLQAFGLRPPRVSPADARHFEDHLRARPAEGRGFAQFRRDNPVETRHVPDAFRAARGAHLAPNAPDAQRAMARELGDNGLVITLDPGVHAPAMAGEGLSRIAASTAALLPSEKELAVLAPGLACEAGLTLLNDAGAPVAAVKRGGAGSVVREANSGQSVAIPALPVAAIDPTGAGDAYCGGFLAGLIRTRDPFAAACFGTVSASFAVEDFGPFRLLDAAREEARARLEDLVRRVPGLDSVALLAHA